MKSSFKKTIAGFALSCCIFSFCSTGVSAAVIDYNETVSSAPTTTNDSSLPSSYSSKDMGYVTEIKNQLYSDCWAYASLATFESTLLRNG